MVNKFRFIVATAMVGCALHNLPVAASTSANDAYDPHEAYKTLFLKRQVEQSMSVGRAIKSIASHYPQEVVSIVDIALDTYPEKYREIIYAAVSAQPASTEDIVQLAIDKGVGSCSSIVKQAIKAEPSYVDFVVQTAANATPDELDEIVRVAVQIQPDSADSVVRTLSQNHPNKVIEIMTTALDAVPFVGEYVVDALLTLFPGQAEAVVSTAVKQKSLNKVQMTRILESAKNNGMADEEIRRIALANGVDEAEITAALN